MDGEATTHFSIQRNLLWTTRGFTVTNRGYLKLVTPRTFALQEENASAFALPWL